MTLHNLNIAPPTAKDASGILAMDATARTYRYLDADRGRSAAEGRSREGRQGRGSEEMTSRSQCDRVCWPASLLLALLAGCGGEQEELQQWMEQQRREVKPNVPPLSPPKKFDPQPYARAQAVEPFSTQKLPSRSSRKRGSRIRCWRPSSTAARSRWRPIRWTA